MADFDVKLSDYGIECTPISSDARAWLRRTGKDGELTGPNKALLRDRASAHVLAEALCRNALSWNDAEAMAGRAPLLPTYTDLRDRHVQLAHERLTAQQQRTAGKSVPPNKVFFRDSGWFAPMSWGEAIFSSISFFLLLSMIIFGMYQCSKNDEAEKAERQKHEAEDASQKAKDDAENRRKGFNCLSNIDGSQPDIVEKVKARLRDPDSFEHVETDITPAGPDGYHNVLMTYRSRNGFGGMVEGRAIGRVRSSDCRGYVTSVE